MLDAFFGLAWLKNEEEDEKSSAAAAENCINSHQ